MHKLYYQDIHITSFDALVTECVREDGSGFYRIVLDRTAFFPEEGGQVADKGTINEESVLDVQIKEDTIYHLLKTPLTVGSTVHGEVDWQQRFDFMQQHSGEHIISGLIHTHYGYDNVGFHLGLSEVTLDVNGSLNWEQLRAIEKEANQAIWSNLPIRILYPSPQELSDMQYRSKLDLKENVRLVEIPGIDLCACCAPHVESTGQIGLIKITNVQSHRGGVRINMLCGNRALQDYTQKQDSVFRISTLLSAKQSAVSDAVLRLQEEQTKQKERANYLQASLLELQIKSLPTPDQTENVLLFVEDMDAIAMRNAVNRLTEKYNGYCGIFAGDEQNGYHFTIGSLNKDCRELANQLRQAFQAKGGGTAPMIQGSIRQKKAEIELFFANNQNALA